VLTNRSVGFPPSPRFMGVPTIAVGGKSGNLSHLLSSFPQVRFVGLVVPPLYTHPTPFQTAFPSNNPPFHHSNVEAFRTLTNHKKHTEVVPQGFVGFTQRSASVPLSCCIHLLQTTRNAFHSFHPSIPPTSFFLFAGWQNRTFAFKNRDQENCRFRVSLNHLRKARFTRWYKTLLTLDASINTPAKDSTVSGELATLTENERAQITVSEETQKSGKRRAPANPND